MDQRSENTKTGLAPRRQGYQRTPAAILAALIEVAADESASAEDLRQIVRSIAPALADYQRNGLALRDIVLSAHADESSPDHSLAKKIVAACNACKQFNEQAIAAGALVQHMELSSQMRDYGEAIQRQELDGSEPEFDQLIRSLVASERSLETPSQERHS